MSEARTSDEHVYRVGTDGSDRCECGRPMFDALHTYASPTSKQRVSYSGTGDRFWYDANGVTRPATNREIAGELERLSATVSDLQCEHDSLLRGRKPTHRCKVCGALWIDWGDSWSLFSRHCGQCCDNVAMGDQIEALPVIRPAPESEPVCTEHDWQQIPDGPIACVECGAEKGSVHETKAVRDSIAPNKQCPKCQRFFWLDKFDGHDCRPQKSSGQSKLTHKAGDICEVCGGAWVSVSNVGGVAHICPGSPLNGFGDQT